MRAEARVSRSALLRYGFVAMPIAFAGMPLYIHAPDYYATQLNVSLSTLGMALLFLRLIDALQDPILGALSDKWAAYRFTIMGFSVIVLIMSVYALFHPIEGHAFWWFIITVFFATTAFSFVTINLNTLGALWSKDTHEKTRITTAREAFGLLGLILAVTLPSFLQNYFSKAYSFHYLTLFIVILLLAGIFIFHSWWRQNRLVFVAASKPTFQLTQTLLNLPKDTRQFFAIYFFSMLASSMPAVIVLFYIRDLLGVESLTGVFLLLYFFAGVLGMPLWRLLSKKFSKNFAWIVAMQLAALSFIWAFFLQAGDTLMYGIICVLSGIALGAELALPPAILADQIQRFQEKMVATTQFALLNFLAKAALSVGSVLCLLILDAVDFNPGKPNSAEALLTLSVLYALVPCFIKFATGLLLWRSPIFSTKRGYDESVFNDNSNGSKHHA